MFRVVAVLFDLLFDVFSTIIGTLIALYFNRL